MNSLPESMLNSFVSQSRSALAMRNLLPILLLLSFLLIATSPGLAATKTDHLPSHQQKPKHHAIASAHPMATQAGLSVLKKGGNAFDAAIAVTSTLAVVEPYGSGIGGGGFWLLYRARDKKLIMIDGRERAPLAAGEKLYQDVKGNIIPGKSINRPSAAGIPGEPAALVHLAKHYGRLPLKRSLQPAIKAARNGFQVSESYRRLAGFRLSAFKQSPEASRIFLRNGKVPALGTVIRQPDLARTLELLGKKGHAGFYRGVVAKRMVAAVKQNGGIWTLKDLAQYRVVERKPVTKSYANFTVVSASPPSSGGVAMLQILNMLKRSQYYKATPLQRMHIVVEAMRRAYRDRAEYLGDPDFVKVPVQRLISDGHAKKLWKTFKADKATDSDDLPKVPVKPKVSLHTTHFSIIDAEGNMVAATLSVNYPFGSCFVAPGTGVLLNDEMDDFSSKPGVPNAYGLIGTYANAIAPGKRPLSSMSPTFVFGRDRIAVIGTPGGSRIITMVLLGILEFEKGASAQQIVDLKRYHHQYRPDKIQLEPGLLNQKQLDALDDLGHEVKRLKRDYGNMHVVIWNKKTGKLEAASDKRGIGEAKVITAVGKGKKRK